MPVPALPYTLQVVVATTPAPSAALVSDPTLSVSGTTEKGSQDRYVLTGSGTKNLDFSSVAAAGAKMVLVYYEQGTTVITVGGTELSQGGMYLVSNPTPTAGLAALAVVHTADAVIRCRILA